MNMKCQAFSGFEGMLLGLLAEGTTIQNLIDQAAQQLGNPILIADSRFRVLYMSQEQSLDIALWNRARLEGYISDEVLQDIRQGRVVERLQRADDPVMAELPNGYHAVRCALRSRGAYRGFIGTYDYRTSFTEEMLRAFVSVGRAVSALAADDPSFAVTEESGYESLLYQLLCCGTIDRAAQVCRRFAPQDLGRRRLVCLSIPEDTGLPAERLKDLYHLQDPKVISTIYEGHLVLLAEQEKLKRAEGSARDSLRNFCGRHSLRAGISFELAESIYVPWAYRQALSCLSISKESWVFYEDVYLQDVRRHCTNQLPAGYFLHPVIRRIAAYDEIYHLDYLETLQEWLLHQGAIRETAEELGIHPNTLKHRLSMIESIAGTEIRRNAELLRQLQVSFLFISA